MDPQLAELPLRDIHAAPPESWWPLAPGWWVLGLLALSLAAWGAWLAWRWYRRYRFQQALYEELSGVVAHYQASRDPHTLARELATLLRRLVVHVAGFKDAAALTGHAWAEFLGQAAGEDAALRAACSDLAEVPYRRAGTVDAEAAEQLARRWIDRSVQGEARHV